MGVNSLTLMEVAMIRDLVVLVAALAVSQFAYDFIKSKVMK
jgi:hypothetical protein